MNASFAGFLNRFLDSDRPFGGINQIFQSLLGFKLIEMKLSNLTAGSPLSVVGILLAVAQPVKSNETTIKVNTYSSV